MSDLSDYLENLFCNVLRPGGAAIPVITPYVALFETAVPAENGTLGSAVEVTATVSSTTKRIAAGFGAATTGTMSNAAVVDFGNAGAAKIIVGCALYDDPDPGEGNLLAIKTFASSVSSVAGVAFRFPIGSLTFTMA